MRASWKAWLPWFSLLLFIGYGALLVSPLRMLVVVGWFFVFCLPGVLVLLLCYCSPLATERVIPQGMMLGIVVSSLLGAVVGSLGIFAPLYFLLAEGALCVVLVLAVRTSRKLHFASVWTNGDWIVFMVLAVILLALLYLPLSYVGEETSVGKVYARGFGHDFLRNMAYTVAFAEAEKLPPENPYLVGFPVHYYWFYFMFPALLQKLEGVDVLPTDQLLIVWHLLFSLVFLFLFFEFVRSQLKSLFARIVAGASFLFFTSYNGLFALLIWARLGFMRGFLEYVDVEFYGPAQLNYLFYPAGIDAPYRYFLFINVHLLALAIYVLSLGFFAAYVQSRRQPLLFLSCFSAVIILGFSDVIGALCWLHFMLNLAWLSWRRKLKSPLLVWFIFVGLSLLFSLWLRYGGKLYPEALTSTATMPALEYSSLLYYAGSFFQRLVVEYGGLFFGTLGLLLFWRKLNDSVKVFYLVFMFILVLHFFLPPLCPLKPLLPASVASVLNRLAEHCSLKSGLVGFLLLSLIAGFFWEHIRQLRTRFHGYVGLIFLLVLLPGMLSSFCEVIFFSQRQSDLTVVSSDELKAAEWLRDNSPPDTVVLADPDSHLTVTVFARRKMLLGNLRYLESASLREGDAIARREQLLNAVLRAGDHTALRSVPQEYQPVFLLWGFHEVANYGFPSASLSEYVAPVFVSGQTALYLMDMTTRLQ